MKIIFLTVIIWFSLGLLGSGMMVAQYGVEYGQYFPCQDYKIHIKRVILMMSIGGPINLIAGLIGSGGGNYGVKLSLSCEKEIK